MDKNELLTRKILEEKIDEYIRNIVYKTNIRDMIQIFSENSVSKIVKKVVKNMIDEGQLPQISHYTKTGIGRTEKRYKIIKYLLTNNDSEYITLKNLAKELNTSITKVNNSCKILNKHKIIDMVKSQNIYYVKINYDNVDLINRYYKDLERKYGKKDKE